MLSSSVTACPCWSANIHRAPSKSRRQLRPTSDGPAGRVSTVPRSYFLVRARLLWVSIRRYRSSWTRKAIVFKGSRAPRTTAGCERLEADREKAGASDLLRGPKALTGQVRCGDPTTDKLAPAAQHHFRIFSVMSRHRALVKGSKLSILLALSSLDVVRCCRIERCRRGSCGRNRPGRKTSKLTRSRPRRGAAPRRTRSRRREGGRWKRKLPLARRRVGCCDRAGAPRR